MASAGTPRITVFMAVYNREKLLRRAMESILSQSLGDFEFLLIDDGSVDRSVEIIRSYTDPRIRLVVHSENHGIPRTRNHGLQLARGEYLAILDSDDYAHPQRLDKQLAFLDAHPDVAAVGSWAKRVNHEDRTVGLVMRPLESREIRARLLFVGCFKNPTMMARTQVMREFGYREEFVYCQDIDLWARMSRKYPLVNLPEFLICYRTGGMSRESDEVARAMKTMIARDQLHDLCVDFDQRDLDWHYGLRNMGSLGLSPEFVDWAEDWLERLLGANARSRCYPEPEFTQAAAEQWFLLGFAALAAGRDPRRFYKNARFRRRAPACLTRHFGMRPRDLRAAARSFRAWRSAEPVPTG